MDFFMYHLESHDLPLICYCSEKFILTRQISYSIYMYLLYSVNRAYVILTFVCMYSYVKVQYDDFTLKLNNIKSIDSRTLTYSNFK